MMRKEGGFILQIKMNETKQLIITCLKAVEQKLQETDEAHFGNIENDLISDLQEKRLIYQRNQRYYFNWLLISKDKRIRDTIFILIAQLLEEISKSKDNKTYVDFSNKIREFKLD